MLTILGLNGGCISLSSSLFQSMRRKNEWLLTSPSPLSMQPSLFPGFFVINLRRQYETINNVSYGFRQINALPLCKYPWPLYSESWDRWQGCWWWLQTAHPRHPRQMEAVLQASHRGGRQRTTWTPKWNHDTTGIKISQISPVHTFSIGLVVDNFRSNVVWGSAKCLEILILTQNFIVLGSLLQLQSAIKFSQSSSLSQLS